MTLYRVNVNKKFQFSEIIEAESLDEVKEELSNFLLEAFVQDLDEEGYEAEIKRVPFISVILTEKTPLNPMRVPESVYDENDNLFTYTPLWRFDLGKILHNFSEEELEILISPFHSTEGEEVLTSILLENDFFLKFIPPRVLNLIDCIDELDYFSENTRCACFVFASEDDFTRLKQFVEQVW